MKNRRFLSMLLAMMMVVSMFASIPVTAFAAGNTVTVSDWDGLQKAIKNASSGQTIQLTKDITCKQNGGDRIKVEGKTITLDLNGHALDRNRTKKDDDGHVIEVKSKSTLTITDSAKGGKGVITGNTAEGNGGGIYHKGDSLTIDSCTISDNTAKGVDGGGSMPGTT